MLTNWTEALLRVGFTHAQIMKMHDVFFGYEMSSLKEAVMYNMTGAALSGKFTPSTLLGKAVLHRVIS